jgi:uracil-DNA glycosylase
MDKIWLDFIMDEMMEPYMEKLSAFLSHERKTQNIYPQRSLVFNALELTPFADTKVVWVGQDPYHSPDTAHGLSFSSLQKKTPPSLKYIYEEFCRTYGLEYDLSKFNSNDLSYLARQGVLLLNRVLTVRQGQPNSHKGQGWEVFTEKIIRYLCEHKQTPVVFILLGKEAQNLDAVIDEYDNLNIHVLRAPHPAAEAYSGGKAGFLGSNVFGMCNRVLRESGQKEIDWLEQYWNR